MRKVSVSIVSHQNADEILPLLMYLIGIEEIEEVIVVSNIPETFKLDLFSGTEKLRFFTNKVIKGFGANHNFAFRESKADFFCILNPDVSLDSNIFQELIENLNKPSVGLVGPKLVGAAGEPADSARNFLTLSALFGRLFLREKIIADYQGPLVAREVDWISGAFMLFRSDVFRKLNGFDERYFMYVEDMDLCSRMRELGWKVMYVPKVLARHFAKRKSRTDLHHFLWHCNSLLRYIAKHPLRFLGLLRR